MKQYDLIIRDWLESKGFTPRKASWGWYAVVNNIKLEWKSGSNCLVAGYGNTKNDVIKIHEFLTDNLPEGAITRLNSKSIILYKSMNIIIDQFKELVELIEDWEWEWEEISDEVSASSVDISNINFFKNEAVSMKAVFGDQAEVKFTDAFLKNNIQGCMNDVLACTGVYDEVKSIDHQVKTSDGKFLDNIAILDTKERVMIESQVCELDPMHASKIIYYLSNLATSEEKKNKNKVILIAESFKDEHRVYCDFMNEHPAVDMSLVRATFEKDSEGNFSFKPILEHPTISSRTNSILRQIKSASDTVSDIAKTNRKLVANLLDGYKLKINKWHNNEGYEGVNFYILDHESGRNKIKLWVTPAGKMNIKCEKSLHENTDIFYNNTDSFILKDKNTGKSQSATEDFEEFKEMYVRFNENL